MVVDTRRRYDASLMRYAPGSAHGDAVRLAQPIRFHALLRRHRVVAIEDAVTVQQRRGRQHGDVATCGWHTFIHMFVVTMCRGKCADS